MILAKITSFKNMSRVLLIKYFYLLFCFSINLNINNAKNIGESGRLFRYTYTSTVVKSNVVTSLVPSSCVQVEATLPPCRSVRFLRFPKLPSITFNYPSSHSVVSNVSEPEVKSTALGWGEYLGIYAPTVTITRTDLHITTVEDPSVVVTFAVKGCRPLKLPLDLHKCPPEQPPFSIEEIITTSTVVMPQQETILPTNTMSVINPSTTDYEDVPNFPEENKNLLVPSAIDINENGPAQPTEPLQHK